jgi:hypothetical protein
MRTPPEVAGKRHCNDVTAARPSPERTRHDSPREPRIERAIGPARDGSTRQGMDHVVLTPLEA